MGLLKKILGQCRKPTGHFGRLLAHGMNLGHASLTTWGLSHIDISSDSVSLDIGCGGGKTLNRLATKAENGKAYGIDCAEPSITVSRKKNRKFIMTGRVEVLQGTVSSMPFADEMFDLVTVIESHYFWPDFAEDLLEIKRVLKPSGQLLIVGAVYKTAKFERRNRRIVKESGMTYLSAQEMADSLHTAGFAQASVYEERRKGWFCATGIRPD